jgi:hypothetical protein
MRKISGKCGGKDGRSKHVARQLTVTVTARVEMLRSGNSNPLDGRGR